jgi:hypothetical protein
MMVALIVVEIVRATGTTYAIIKVLRVYVCLFFSLSLIIQPTMV